MKKYLINLSLIIVTLFTSIGVVNAASANIKTTVSDAQLVTGKTITLKTLAESSSEYEIE